MTQIAPSLLAADFLNLEKAVELVNSYADLFHMDVMDGVFVPNISFGFPVVKAVAAKAEKELDVHLMITDPMNYAIKFAQIPNVGWVSFHINASPNPSALLVALKQEGVKAGLAINPDIPVETLYPYLDLCDFVVIMGVYAGFGGQSFIESTLDKVRAVKNEIKARGLKVLVQVDGGVKTNNARTIVDAGADILVAGTAVFAAEDPAQVIEAMR